MMDPLILDGLLIFISRNLLAFASIHEHQAWTPKEHFELSRQMLHFISEPKVSCRTLF